MPDQDPQVLADTQRHSSPERERTLSAVVLNYNGRELLEVAVPSLARQTRPATEVVVVDNGSTDDSLAYLAEHWPDVRVLALPQNIGVTAALNACVAAASGELIGLFNNDIELEPTCLAELARGLERHPEAACAAAKLIDFYDRDVVDGAGDVYEWTGEANRRGQGERDGERLGEPIAVFGACGGAALYRRSALEAVGPFDDRFFAIYEDVDWSFRAQLLGYSCRYVPSAVVYHMGSATLGRELSDFVLYQNWRNGIWVVVKNYPLAAFARHGHELAGSQLHNLAWAIRTRRVGVLMRVWRDALLGMPAMLAKRRAVQRSRVVQLRDLERLIGVES